MCFLDSRSSNAYRSLEPSPARPSSRAAQVPAHRSCAAPLRAQAYRRIARRVAGLEVRSIRGDLHVRAQASSERVPLKASFMIRS